MKKVRKNSIYILIAIVLGIFVLIFVSHYNKPVINVDKTEAYDIFSANEFLNELDNADEMLNAKYIDKVIRIEGVINQISYRNDKLTLILCGEFNSKFILCEMELDQKEKIKQYTVGEKITVKGIYKGCLMDAIFLNCVILETNVNI